MAMRPNSRLARVACLPVGGEAWLPATDAGQALSIQRTLSAKARYPAEMQGYEVQTSRHVAVALDGGDTTHLVRVVRTA